MKGFSIRLFVGILFSAIGTASLFLTKELLIPAVWLSFGNGLILTDYHSKRRNPDGTITAVPVPKVRFFIGLFLISLAVVLLFFQIYLDFA